MTPVLVDTKRSLLLGVLFGAAYGVMLRMWADESNGFGVVLVVMSVAFLVLVPFVIGYLSVIPHPRPGWIYRIFVPWIPSALSMLVMWMFGGEGAICIVMALPAYLLFSTIGGVTASFVRAKRTSQIAALVVAPLVFGGLERGVDAPDDVRVVTSTIDVAAPPSAVWREIVTVPPIARSELPPALYLAMGFPAPISATIDHEGLGGVRRARFERGVLFLETVTDFRENELLSFRIAAQTDSIPPTTLDRHVTIGGPYFDVLQGTYRLEPLPNGAGTRMRLESRLRVSTHFNVYSGPWVDAIMRSVQETILVVEKRRAEAGRAAAS